MFGPSGPRSATAGASGATPSTLTAFAGPPGALGRELAIGEGERVATLLPNVPAMLELHYAVPGSGGVLVPLNTRLAGAEYAYILSHSGARTVFAATSLAAPLEDCAGAARPIGSACGLGRSGGLGGVRLRDADPWR